MAASLDAFAALFSREDARIDLGRACLMLAQDVYPDLDVEHYLGEIEGMALALRGRVPQGAGAEERVVALNEYLFGELRYRGNTEAYYDPRNSYLNEVIERRTGIPITLSVLYMEVGRRAGLPLQGVSFPGHFLVRVRVRGGTLVLDPFQAGIPQSADELRERLKRVVPDGALGGGRGGKVALGELPIEQFLEPATNRQIVARVLRNLKTIYREQERPERLLAVLNRILLVAPDSSVELRDRAYAYEKLECYRAALKDLTDYAEREPAAADSEEVRVRLLELTRLCARLN